MCILEILFEYVTYSTKYIRVSMKYVTFAIKYMHIFQDDNTIKL